MQVITRNSNFSKISSFVHAHEDFKSMLIQRIFLIEYVFNAGLRLVSLEEDAADTHALQQCHLISTGCLLAVIAGISIQI